LSCPAFSLYGVQTSYQKVGLSDPFFFEKTFDICFSPHAPGLMDRTKILSRLKIIYEGGETVCSY